jgi:hypothetical protein
VSWLTLRPLAVALLFVAAWQSHRRWVLTGCSLLGGLAAAGAAWDALSSATVAQRTLAVAASAVAGLALALAAAHHVGEQRTLQRWAPIVVGLGALYLGVPETDHLIEGVVAVAALVALEVVGGPRLSRAGVAGGGALLLWAAWWGAAGQPPAIAGAVAIIGAVVGCTWFVGSTATVRAASATTVVWAAAAIAIARAGAVRSVDAVWAVATPTLLLSVVFSVLVVRRSDRSTSAR